MGSCLRLLFLLALLVFPVHEGFSQYVTLEGKQFKDKDGKKFFPLICNYLVEYVYTGHDTSKLFLSPDRSADGWCFSCSTMTACLDEMSRHFNRIRNMGFNGIRLMGSNPVYYCRRGETEGFRIRAWDLDSVLANHCDSGTLNNYHDYFFNRSFGSNPAAARIFGLTDSVLARAGKAGLYVILVAGGGAGDYSISYPSRYARYLKALAKHIRSSSPQVAREALMAYDLCNEPSSSWNPSTLWPQETAGHSKKDVYKNVKRFNKRVKRSDPDHLTTLGGRSFDEIFEYDPTFLSVDFYSAHFYPVETTYDTSPFLDKLQRVQGHFAWLSDVLRMPYIVGETGFRSEPGGTGPDGTNEEQQLYAELTLEMTRFYGGSGYSWWTFQDYDWSKCDRYYGLTYWDNQKHLPVEKPAAKAFRKFNDTVPPRSFDIPGNYNDPFNHRRHNPRQHVISGQILDQDGIPVKNAFILGWTPIRKDEKGNIHFELHYTFSDTNGDYTIIPFDFDPVNPPNTGVMASIRVTAAGYSRFTSGWYDNDTGVPLSEYRLIVLRKLKD